MEDLHVIHVSLLEAYEHVQYFFNVNATGQNLLLVHMPNGDAPFEAVRSCQCHLHRIICLGSANCKATVFALQVARPRQKVLCRLH